MTNLEFAQISTMRRQNIVFSCAVQIILHVVNYAVLIYYHDVFLVAISCMTIGVVVSTLIGVGLSWFLNRDINPLWIKETKERGIIKEFAGGQSGG